MSDEAADEYSFEGDITDYWKVATVRQWVLHLPGMTPTALRLYLLLRAMLTTSPRGLRRMTNDQLCYLLTEPGDKPVSERTLRDAMKILRRRGLLVTGERLVKSSGRGKISTETCVSYKVVDLPTEDHTGWRTTWDKLDAYRADWRENPVDPGTHIYEPDDNGRTGRIVRQISATRNDQGESDETAGQIVRQKSANARQKSANARQKSAAKIDLTCGNEGVPSGSPSVSPLSGAGVDASAKDEREAAAPKAKPTPGAVPNQRDGDQDDAARVAAAWAEALTEAGTPMNRRAEEAVRRDVAVLLADGESVDYLTAAAVDMARRDPTFRSLSKHLEHYTPKAAGGRERCDDHPRHLRAGCMECAMAVPA